MKILLIDPWSCFLDFALRCEAEGHQVKIFIAPTSGGAVSTVGDGLLDRVDDWKPYMKWADLITISSNVKYMRLLEPYRRQGLPIFGCNVECAEWELDRTVGQKVLEDAGVKCMDYVSFTDYDKAIEFVKKSGKRYVSKPCGDVDKALSYVSKGPRDMIFMLEKWKKIGKIKVPFILQEFTSGIEMAVGGWFGMNGFSKYFLENFEFKKLMNGEIGVNTPEMGTAMKYVTLEESKLAQMVLKPLEGALFRSGYTGYIDVSVIVSEDGTPLPLEHTCRFGWPLFQIQQALHPDIANWMLDSCNGKDSFTPSTDVAIGVVAAMPPFPHYEDSDLEACSDFPVWGMTVKNRYNIHPAEMKMGTAPEEKGGKIVKESMLVSAGSFLLICSGTGSSVTKAKKMAYDVLGDLEIPNSPIYRTDIGDRLEKQIPKLQKMGFATSWRF